VTKLEQVERDLTVSKFSASVFEEQVGRLPEVQSFNCLLANVFERVSLLQLWMTQDALRHLEENHLSTDRFDDLVGALEPSDEIAFLLLGISKEVLNIIQKVNHEIVTFVEVHQEVLWLWQEY
jgi:hypothetical protein